MDAQPKLLTPALEILRKLSNGDPEGAIRDTLHRFVVDPLLDEAFGRIRGGPSTGPEAPPSVAALALPESPILGTTTNTDPNLAALLERVETLEEANRGLEDTIARLSRENESLREQLASIKRAEDLAVEAIHAVKPQVKTRAKRRLLQKAQDLDSEIEQEATVDIETIAREHGINPGTLRRLKCEGKMPAPIGKRGRNFLWRRTEIDAWAAQRHQPPAAPPEDRNLLDGQAICKILGCTTAMFYYHCSKNGFPKPAGRRGKGYVYHRAEVEAWIKQRTNEKGATHHMGETSHKSTATVRKICVTCADRHKVGRLAVCGSESSPHRNKSVTDALTCDWYRQPGNYRPVPMDEED